MTLSKDNSPHAADTFTPATAEELARFMTKNAEGERRALFPVGGRTALHYGYAPREDAMTIATGELTRVVDYPARDMTITVEAGMRVDELQRTLAAEGQRLPIDIPQGHRATIGGAIATNTCGPGRLAHGTFRDYLIGVSAIDGQGRLFSAGGRVVKNVAGYDLCKLMVGSLGTLAVITQVTLKLRPITVSRQMVWATFLNPTSIDAALERLLCSETRPVAIEVLSPASVRSIRSESRLNLPVDRCVLCLAFEGSPAETDWQTCRVTEEIASFSPDEMAVVATDDSNALWSTLIEYQAASDDPLTFQASVPPSQAMSFVSRAIDADVAVQCHAANGIIVGHLPDRCSTVEAATRILHPLRDMAESHCGSLVVLNCDDNLAPTLSLFGSRLPSAIIEGRVKETFDPHHVLSPDRFGERQASAC